MNIRLNHTILSPAGSRRNRGTVLIVVMRVALGLVSLALYFGDSMVFEYRIADNTVASLEAAHAVESARRYVTFLLKTLITEPGQIPDPVGYKAEQVDVGEASFWMIGRPGADEKTIASPVSGSGPVFRLVDEGSKLNLNTATPEMLAMLPGMTQDLAAAIKDWRDTDSTLTDGGAESQDYLLKDMPYNCKNSAFETVEELRLVMGCDRNILYGEDLNHNGVLDPNEDDGTASLPDDNKDGILNPGLFEYLTVFSREPNTQADGTTACVNIRTNRTALLQVLSRALPGRAQQIDRALGNSTNSMRSILELYVRCAAGAGMTPAEFALIEDQITVDPGKFIAGRVNVNTASAAVLACFPGGTDVAQQLVAYRSGKSAEDLKSVARVAEALQPAAAIAIGPYVTTRSYQFEADVAAVGHNGRGFRRDLMVFEMTGTEPVVIYRRDLTRLGWPLGEETRRQLASTKE